MSHMHLIDEQLKEYRYKRKQELEDAFQGACDILFDENPQLESFSWQQEEDDGYKFFSRSPLDLYINGQNGFSMLVDLGAVANSASSMLKLFEESELESLFGMDKTIKVTISGIEVTENS
jgi:hypothetical protein